MNTSTPVLLVGIAVLALGTYAFRFVGPVLAARVTIPPNVHRLTTVGSVVLLAALVATSTLIDDQHFAEPSRIVGVAVGGVLAWRRAPFVVVVAAAAACAALLRLAGLP
ncbi:AzlD domain-containing protein [Williamsia sp. DF01-3]|uniref:AzlD domain-containing protein n=1 Tax=Williamsia sp. DF01-3 TaxID=2934157 RepID=UPI001FF56B5E|nr:AzlD domain-containing protein [Williamsia sp. DF01-3]MCK0520547.1 AzlD domain-containing protein [Williamsia sp. DF01-3]